MPMPARGEHRPDISVLSVAPVEDQLALARTLAHSRWPLCPGSHWKLAACHSLASAVRLLARRSIQIVLCDCDLGPRIWTEVLERVEQLPAPPVLIVTSRSADERLWAEALNRGVYDVLAKPFDTADVVRSLSLAWLSWSHGRERGVARPA